MLQKVQLEPRDFRGGGDALHNHDADSKACFNRQILFLLKGKQWRTCVKDRAN
jgi:hypothetical protein